MPSTDAAAATSSSTIDPARERIRQRLQSALAKRDGGSADAAPASSPASTAAGGGGGGKGGKSSKSAASAAPASDRPPTEEEQETFARELLQQNAEMRRAFVASYYLVLFAVGGFALWFLVAHLQTPFAEDASHLLPLKRDVSGGEVGVSLGLATLACVLAAIAAYTQNPAPLRIGLALSVFPLSRFAQAYWIEPRLLASAWHLLWIPVAPPFVLGVQLVVQGMLDDMDTQVIDFYKRMRAGLKGA
jgi:hypothetical protein